MATLFSDLNQFTASTKPLLIDVESIYQSIINILSTRKGERPFLPRFGVDLDDTLFDLMDEASSLEVLSEVTEAIEDSEPRVIIDTSRTDVIPDPDNNSFELILGFKLKGFEDKNFDTKSFTINQLAA
jgi:phage baseplate assembly protein W